MKIKKVYFFLICLFLFIAGACGNNSNNSVVNVFGDDQPSASAVPLNPADPTITLNLVLGLARQQNGLAKHITEQQNPNSLRYQQFDQIQDIAQTFGATQVVQEKVLGYMSSQGVQLSVDASGAFASGTATVAQLNQIFSTQLYEYNLPNLGTFIAPSSTRTPTLPKSLTGFVTEVLGLNTEPGTWNNITSDPNPLTRPTNQVDTPGSPYISGTPQGCAEALAENGFTPNQFLTAYGVTPLHNAGIQGQGINMAVLEFNSFEQSSIDTYTNCFGLPISYTPQVIQLGSSVPPIASGEPFLDIEVISMVAPKLSNLYVYQTVSQSYASWVTLFAAPLNSPEIQVVSASLGSCELSWTPTFIQLMEQVLMSYSAAGIHFFNSAGDSGSSTCYHHDKVTTAESASYPSTSQYVTSVGGTNLLLNTDNSIDGQGVWNDLDFPAPYNKGTGAGGGGPSIYISTPSWQSAVNSGSMRSTPDLAFYADPAPGYTINTSINGWYNDGGTSAATPFMAASTALLLQIAASKNVGFDVSPLWIYTLAEDSSTYNSIFQDVVIGNNDVFGVGCCSAGPGYDQASGWGSMNISEIATLLFNF